MSYKFEGGKEGTLTPSDKLVAQLFAALDGPQPSPPQVDCALARADYTTVTYGSLVIPDATGCANRWPGTFYADLQELEAQLPT